MIGRRSLLVVIAGLLLLSVQTPINAQSGSGIKGVILDKDGTPVRGATVAVANTTLGVTQGAVTDEKGEFRIVPLPPGRNYTVTVSFPTMGTITVSDLEVINGRVANVPVTLRPSAELTEKVKVTAKGDVVNTESTETKTVFGAEFIDSLPILGRDYQDVLSLAPGVSDVNNTGNPNIHGARDTDVVTLVDGVSTTDPFSGKRGQELNIDSIQEIEVKTSGASAEFSRAEGGFVNIITKSGGNEFQGKFSFLWRGRYLDHGGAGIDDPRLHGGLGEIGLRNLSFNDYYPFLSLSGPIKKDKAWYYFTAEYIQIQEPVNALTQAFVRGTKENRTFGKVSWDVSSNHKLVFTATLDPQTYTNLGLDSFTAVESGYTDKRGGLDLVLKETSVFSPNVFLETTLQHFQSKPQQIPTLNADTNHNGILFIDRNHNGFFEASERDPGEDWDRDGAWDVFEDFNHNGQLDKPQTNPPCTICGEDLDGDGHLTPLPMAGSDGSILSLGGCEGPTVFQGGVDKNGNPLGPPIGGRKDYDCDGHLDTINEDMNHNGKLDPGEDIDGDHILDLGFEDRNHDGRLDDRPFPNPSDVIFICNPDPKTGLAPIPCDSHNAIGREPYYFPYAHARPIPGDRDFTTDFETLRTSGPYFEDYTSTRGRITLRQDLTVFIPDWHGQHDMKFGGVVERETYSQDTQLRPAVFTKAHPEGTNVRLPLTLVAIPAGDIAKNQVAVFNTATNMTFGMYLQDTYKPLPNLTLGLGVRFDREATDSFGYTPFDPVAERNQYDSVRNLFQREPNDKQFGNDDGIQSLGFCSDPIFTANGESHGCPNNPYPFAANVTAVLNPAVLSRLTQHHFATDLAAAGLQALFPEAINQDGSTNLAFLRTQGATFEQKEPFRLTNNNLAPRLSISWDPWGDSKTKVFGNWSRFYDKLFLQTIVPEEGPDTIYRYYIADPTGVTPGGIPDNQIGPVVTKAPPTAFQVDRGLQTPFVDEFTAGFERELAPEVSLKITYINRRFENQTQSRDINHTVRIDPSTGKMIDQGGALQPTQGAGGMAIGAQQTPDGRPDLFVENFFFNQIYRVGNFNHSRYKGIEIEVTKRLSRKWQLESSYVYSRAVGNAESFLSNFNVGVDAASIPQQFGYLDFDQRHVVKFNASTFLPGDWQLGGVLSWSSGLPYSVLDRFTDLDNFNYPEIRLLFGRTVQTASGAEFIPTRRNSRRNAAVYNINVRASKGLVLGKLNSKIFINVDNLLNTDDLTIFNYVPDAPNRGGALQLESIRRFGRRYSLGFQFEF